MENCSVCKKETTHSCGAGYVGRVYIDRSTLTRDESGNKECKVPVCEECGDVPSIISEFAMGQDGWIFCPQHAEMITDEFIDDITSSLSSHPRIAERLMSALSLKKKV